MKQIKMNIKFPINETIDCFCFLKKNYFSATQIKELFQTKSIFVNYKLTKDNVILFPTDILTIQLPSEKSNIPLYEPSFDIIYEDEYFLLVNKPAQLDSLSSKRHYQDNLSSQIMGYYQKKQISATIHLVNRLDYLTQGLLLVAKHGLIHSLCKQTPMIKKYLLEVEGHLEKKEDTINIKMKKEENSVKRIIDIDGKEAITHYVVKKETANTSLIEATLFTGRTHQLRLTFAHLGHPIVGDDLYGSNIKGLLRLCSYYLEFEHPITKKRLIFEVQPNF